jgi:hypothetical protein
MMADFKLDIEIRHYRVLTAELALLNHYGTMFRIFGGGGII